MDCGTTINAFASPTNDGTLTFIVPQLNHPAALRVLHVARPSSDQTYYTLVRRSKWVPL